MGLLEDALGKAAPGGGLSKPLMIALGALLVGKMLSHGGATAATQPAQPQLDPSQAGASPDDGGLFGGLGGLLGKLQSAGHGDTVNSWVGSGQNAPIDPNALGSVLGQQTVGGLAQQTGLNPQDLLSQLSTLLPGLVDKLTPDGRMPNQDQLSSLLQQLGLGQQQQR